MNLEKHLVDYLEFCEIEKNLSQNTIRMYDFYLRDFLEFSRNFLDKEKISTKDLDKKLVNKYRLDLNRRENSKSSENYKKSTQKTFLVGLRALLKYLIVQKDLDVLSPEQVILGKSEAHVPDVLNKEQLERLLSVQDLNKISGVRDRTILETLFSTGLRVSELVSLNVDDISFDSNEFTVIGKGRKPRTVYLSPSAKKWLKKYLDTRSDNFIPLFLRYSGKKMDEGDLEGESLRLTARSVQRMIKKYTVRAGISADVTPHTLRHTFATGLLKSGADLRSVQELLGHSSVTTTQIYTHITNKQLKEVHKRFHKDVKTSIASKD